MPRIDEKHDVLGGRGHVCRYLQGSSAGKYFYREWDNNTKKLKAKVIKGATTLEEAIDLATDVAFALREQPDKEQSNPDPITLLRREERLISRQEKLQKIEEKGGAHSIPIDKAIKGFLDQEKKRVDGKQLEERSYSHKYYCMRHIGMYLKSKLIKNTGQIKLNTFQDYPLFRAKTTRIVQNREVAVLGEWLKAYLVRNKYVDQSLWISGSVVPKIEVRMTDRMANPAINAEDFKTIVDYIRDVWRPEALHPNGVHKYPLKRSWYYRNLFWHYILFSKNTGMSPEEILKMKWRQVEIRDVGRYSESKMRDEVEELEAEGIEVIPTEELDARQWVPNENALGREERLVAYITTIRSKTKQPREIPCNQGKELRRWMRFMKDFLAEHGYKHSITADSYVFMNPDNDYQPVHQQRLRITWRKIVDGLMAEGKLKGHKFSDKRYTLYSLRSTFIEDHLIKGTDIFLLARIAGHDVKTLMQSYERMDIKKRSEEITSIDYGKKKEDIRIVNILDD